MQSSGSEVNYWPGFVDALSNVVLTLVFVLVIFVFALVMASSKVEQKYKEIVDAHAQNKQQKVESTKELAEIEKLKAALIEATEKIKTLERELGESPIKQDSEILVKDVDKEIKGKATIAGNEDKKVSIKFSPSIVNMDEDSQQNLYTTLQPYEESLKTRKILVRAYLDNEAYSIGQRLAYYRILEIRNFLISKCGVPPSSISTKILEGKNDRSGYVEILFDQE